MADVVVVGSYNQDHVWRTPRFPAPGETRLGEFSSGPGGKGFTHAVSAARQGAGVAFVGALGDDAIAAYALGLAAREGIDARCEKRVDAASGTAAILVEAGGQNLIVVGPGANLRLSIAHIDAQANLIGTARVVVTQHEVNMAATRHALEIARASGTLTVHNPAPPLADDDGSLLDRVDVLTPNESEFAHLLACSAGRAVDAAALGAMDDAALHALCRELRVPTVVLTLGARGVFVSHDADDLRGDDAAHYRVDAERVSPVDTTGAGDAFTGALAAGLAAGRGFREAVRFANRVAGLSTEKPGAATSMPRHDEVRARFGD
jgi:ribokinase